MVNFILGLAAGALLSAVVTIVAVRDPDVQKRLGLVPVQLERPPQPDRCGPGRSAEPSTAPAGGVDMLFDPRRRLGAPPRNPVPARDDAGSTGR